MILIKHTPLEKIRILTQKKELNSDLLSLFQTKDFSNYQQHNSGAVIHRMQHLGQGIYSGTFSGKCFTRFGKEYTCISKSFIKKLREPKMFLIVYMPFHGSVKLFSFYTFSLC